MKITDINANDVFKWLCNNKYADIANALLTREGFTIGQFTLKWTYKTFLRDLSMRIRLVIEKKHLHEMRGVTVDRLVGDIVHKINADVQKEELRIIDKQRKKFEKSNRYNSIYGYSSSAASSYNTTGTSTIYWTTS